MHQPISYGHGNILVCHYKWCLFQNVKMQKDLCDGFEVEWGFGDRIYSASVHDETFGSIKWVKTVTSIYLNPLHLLNVVQSLRDREKNYGIHWLLQDGWASHAITNNRSPPPRLPVGNRHGGWKPPKFRNFELINPYYFFHCSSVRVLYLLHQVTHPCALSMDTFSFWIHLP